MSLAFTLDGNYPIRMGKLSMSCGTVAFDTSYPTGGEPVTPDDLGFDDEILSLELVGGMGGYVGDFNKTGLLLLMYMSDNDAGADGPLIQCNDTRDLGALTAVRFLAFGR